MFRVLQWFLSAFVLLFFPAFVFAEEKQQDAPIYLNDYKPVPGTSAPAQEKQQDAPVYLHDYKPAAGTSLPQNTPYLSLRLNVGRFDQNDNPGKLSNKGGGAGYGFDIGVMPEEAVSFHVEFLATSTRYDTTIPPPAWGTIDSRMTLDTTGVLFGVRGSYPLREAYRFHATAGIGYFKSELSAQGSLVGFPGEVSEDDSSFGLHAGAGVEVDLGDWVVGVDYRRLFLDASFGKFGVGSVDIGGNYLGFSVGYLFK